VAEGVVYFSLFGVTGVKCWDGQKFLRAYFYANCSADSEIPGRCFDTAVLCFPYVRLFCIFVINIRHFYDTLMEGCVRTMQQSLRTALASQQETVVLSVPDAILVQYGRSYFPTIDLFKQ